MQQSALSDHALCFAQCNGCCTVAGRRSLLVHYPISSQDCFCLVSAAPTAAGWSAAPLDICSAALPTATRCSEAEASQPAATKTAFQVGLPTCMLIVFKYLAGCKQTSRFPPQSPALPYPSAHCPLCSSAPTLSGQYRRHCLDYILHGMQQAAACDPKQGGITVLAGTGHSAWNVTVCL